MWTKPEAGQEPAVHIVDDNDAMRQGMVRGYLLQGIAAVGYATGEEFLARWSPNMRGVVVLDIDLSPRGGMNGDAVFDRLMALRSHMPVVFHTGPYGNHRRMGVDLVRRRAHVDYCAKDDRAEDVEARILQFLKDEVALYDKIVDERWLLQLLAVEMTHAERVAIEGQLIGKSRPDWAAEIGAHPRALEFKSRSGLDKVPDFNSIATPTAKIMSLATTTAPLMERMGATGERGGKGRLIHLAAIELGHRLRLLSEEQQQALQEALKGRSISPSIRKTGVKALRLMSIEDIAQLKRLLKTGGKEMLSYVLPFLRGPRHRWARHWLTWVSTRPMVTGWEQLSEPELE